MTIDVVGNVVGPLSVKDYFSRRIRWIRARKYMTIGATLMEPFTESILLGIFMTLATERLDLANGMSKKVVMVIHEVMYFTLDYLVYRSLLHSPLVRSTLQGSSSHAGPISTRQPTSISPSSSSSSPTASHANPHPQEGGSSQEQQVPPPHHHHHRQQQQQRHSDEEVCQVELNFFEFLAGWALRECSALFIWLVAMSSNTVRWRQSRQVLKVLRDARVAESN